MGRAALALLTGLARPEDFPHAFAAAWMARDGAGIAALFTEDADFVNVTGLWWRKRADIARAHEYALTSFFADTVLKPGLVRVRRLGTDAAVVHCRFSLRGQRAPDGSTAGPRQTILVAMLERGPDGWLAVAGQNTDVVPGKETHLNTGDLQAVDYRAT